MPSLTTKLEWKQLYQVTETYFHRPDPLVLRACLATAKALDYGLYCCWLLVTGPPSSGKTELYIRTASAYRPHVFTSDLSVPGLLSLDRSRKGEGVLKALGSKGLWLIKDFGSILGMREERRNELAGAMREIFDGSWDRHKGTGFEKWSGQINLIAAATPAIERFHRINADLGDRFLQIRVHRPVGLEAAEKARGQVGKQLQFRRELLEAAKGVLTAAGPAPQDNPEWDRRCWAAAEFIALARTAVIRDYHHNLQDVGETEGATRLFQEILSLLTTDAALHNQSTLDNHQLPILHRLIYDSLHLGRGRILQNFPLDCGLTWSEVRETSGIRHSESLKRTLEDLQAIGLVNRVENSAGHRYHLDSAAVELIKAFCAI